MRDGHIHLEYGPLNRDYVLEFIRAAADRGITDLDILDHTHRFGEFQPAYEHLKKYPVQKQWLEKPGKFHSTLDEYIALIEEVRTLDLPIRVQFGLEVCYTRNTEDFLRETLSCYEFDFLTGAVHSINGILYDMPFSHELLWDKYDVNDIYRDYWQAELDCVNSDLFDRLAHPDTIKMFDIYPSYDLTPTYMELIRALKEKGMAAENNCGCYYRYHHHDLGLSDELLRLFLENDVLLITATDAHHPEHCGIYIKECVDRINAMKERIAYEQTL